METRTLPDLLLTPARRDVHLSDRFRGIVADLGSAVPLLAHALDQLDSKFDPLELRTAHENELRSALEQAIARAGDALEAAEEWIPADRAARPPQAAAG